VIGNCQAGWAVMIVAALRPELFGPIIVAGARSRIGTGCAANIRQTLGASGSGPAD
jgi:hypothetical protein